MTSLIDKEMSCSKSVQLGNSSRKTTCSEKHAARDLVPKNDMLVYAQPGKSTSSGTSCSGLPIPENVDLWGIFMLENARPGSRSETEPIGRVPWKTFDWVTNWSRQSDPTVAPLRNISEDSSPRRIGRTRKLSTKRTPLECVHLTMQRISPYVGTSGRKHNGSSPRNWQVPAPVSIPGMVPKPHNTRIH